MVESPDDVRPLPDFDAPARAADAWMDAGMPRPVFRHTPTTPEQLAAAIAQSRALVDCGAMRNPEAA